VYNSIPTNQLATILRRRRRHYARSTDELALEFLTGNSAAPPQNAFTGAWKIRTAVYIVRRRQIGSRDSAADTTVGRQYIVDVDERENPYSARRIG